MRGLKLKNAQLQNNSPRVKSLSTFNNAMDFPKVKQYCYGPISKREARILELNTYTVVLLPNYLFYTFINPHTS